MQTKITMPAKEPATDPLVGTKYEKVKFINSGSFGYVVLARNKETSAEVAIKFVEVSTEKDVKHRCGSASTPGSSRLSASPRRLNLARVLTTHSVRTESPSAASVRS